MNRATTKIRVLTKNDVYRIKKKQPEILTYNKMLNAGPQSCKVGQYNKRGK